MPRLHGVLGFALYVAGLVGGGIVVLGPAVPLLFLWPAAYLAWCQRVLVAWGYFLVAVTEHVYGVKYMFSGDDVLPGCNIIVSNHRTRLDWLFLWILSLRASVGSGWRIILKAGLKHVPVFGWALQQLQFMFISRSLAVDQTHMDDTLAMYRDTVPNLMLLLFPEGTDLSPKNLARSHAFAEQHSLPKYEYVLHPRVKGWWVCLSALRNDLDFVYDVTVAYTGPMPQSEAALLKANLPTEAHIHVQRHPVESIPTDTEAAACKWLTDSFAAKEQALKAFYTGDGVLGPEQPPRRYSLPKFAAVSCMLAFPATAALLVWALFAFPWFSLAYLVCYVATFIVLRKQCDGLDKYVLARHTLASKLD